jgi:hypothetical protein
MDSSSSPCPLLVVVYDVLGPYASLFLSFDMHPPPEPDIAVHIASIVFLGLVRAQSGHIPGHITYVPIVLAVFAAPRGHIPGDITYVPIVLAAFAAPRGHIPGHITYVPIVLAASKSALEIILSQSGRGYPPRLPAEDKGAPIDEGEIFLRFQKCQCITRPKVQQLQIELSF